MPGMRAVSARKIWPGVRGSVARVMGRRATFSRSSSISNIHAFRVTMTIMSTDTRATSARRSKPWWRARRVIAFYPLLLLVAVFVGHRIWSGHQRRLLIADVQRYQQAGEPVLPEDFNRPDSSDAQNPVPQWRAAAGALDPETAGGADVQFPLTAQQAAEARKAVEANHAALIHAADASRMQGQADWQAHFSGPASRQPLPELNMLRGLANVLCSAAADAHQRGDDAESVERLRQLLAQQRAVYRQPGLTGYMTALAIGQAATDMIDRVAPHLRIGAGQNAAGQPTSPAQVKALIDELLDDKPQLDGVTYAYRCDRMMDLEMALQAGSGDADVPGSSRGSPGASKLVAYVFSSFTYSDGRFALDYTTRAMNAAQSPDLPACQERLKRLPDISVLTGRRHFLISALQLPRYAAVATVGYRVMLARRRAAIALAIRWYATDHEGRSSSILELVPAYLPAVPADPMTGTPLSAQPATQLSATAAAPRTLNVGRSAL